MCVSDWLCVCCGCVVCDGHKLYLSSRGATWEDYNEALMMQLKVFGLVTMATAQPRVGRSLMLN